MKIKQIATNQFYFENDETIVFQSYETIVCIIEKRPFTVKITDGQPQSKTTAKYLNQFLTKFTQFTNYKQLSKF